MSPTPEPDLHTHAPRSGLGAASALGWPAWLRVLAVTPVLALLWLALAWAGGWP